nr:acyltransferase [Escherichia coli]
LKTQDSRLKTQDSRLKTQDSRLKTQDSRLKTQDSFSVDDNGSGNIFVCGDLVNSKENKVQFNGNNNKLIIEDDVECRWLTVIFRGDNNYVRIHKNSKIKGDIVATKGSKVIIGRRTTIGAGFEVVTDKCNVTIGHDCMIARDVILRASDGHPIFDIHSKKRINWAKDIIISSYVWVGRNVSIMKGVSVGSGSVIGYGSIVTKDVPSMCAAAGNPAKIIKRNIIWARTDKAELISDDKRCSSYHAKLTQ